MFIKTSAKIIKGVTYKTHYLTEGYRDENGKVKHRHLCSLGSLSEEKVLGLKAVLNDDIIKVNMSNLSNLKLLCSKEFGSIAVFKELFNKYIKTHINRKYQEIVEAMVINRIFEPKSKNGLGNWIKQVDGIIQSYPKNLPYEALDYLEQYQERMEKNIFTKGKKCNLYLYDMTSTYFEGKAVEMSKHGYSRDHRSDRLQVNIGLVTDDEGCPISVEIMEGNIADKSTIKQKVDDLRTRFGLQNITFVFDRGMKSKFNLDYIQEAGFDYITALSHSQLKKIAEENQKVQQSLFDKLDLAEFEMDNKKYVLSYNAHKSYKDTHDRELLINKTLEKLQKIHELKKPLSQTKMQDKVSRIINKYNCEKYIQYTIEEQSNDAGTKAVLTWKRDEEKIVFNQKHDGFYMVESTDTKKSGEEIEQTYKNLQYVERAFDCVKNLIEIRPVFHYKDARVKGHIVICFLSYYLLFQFKKLCKELLKTNTLDTLLTELRTIAKSYFTIESITISKVVQCSDLQRQILASCNISV